MTTVPQTFIVAEQEQILLFLLSYYATKRSDIPNRSLHHIRGRSSNPEKP